MKKDNSVQKNAAINAINKAISLIFPLLSLIVATKRIGNENFGMVVFCESIVSYFLLLAALGTSNYGIRECAAIRDDKKRTNELINRLFSFNIITSFISFALLIIFIIFVNLSFTEKIILFFTGINVLLVAFDLSWIYKVYENYSFIAFCRIIAEVFSFVLLFLFVREPKQFMFYVFIKVGSNILISVLEYVGISKYIKLKWTNNINIKEFIYPITILFVSIAMISIYFDSDITMLGFMRGNSEVGLYKVASKIYTVVLGLINSICIVSLPRITHYIQNNEQDSYNKLLNDVFKWIVLMTIPATVGILLVCDNVILLIFGPTYASSASVLKIICFAMFFGASNNLFINIVLISNKKDKTIFYLTTIGAIVNILLNLIMIPRHGMYGAAATSLLSEIIVCIGSYIACKKIMLIKNIVKALVVVLVVCVVFVVLCKGIAILKLNVIMEVILQILISAIFYFLILFIINKKKMV